jgi:hypothetical protein
VRSRGDAGAVFVEFALVALLLFTLLFGAFEFGSAWQDRNAVEGAARAGARVASGSGTTRLADFSSLESIKSALNDIGLGNVDYVVIYKSTSADGTVPALCSGAAPTSQSGSCNVYTGTQLQTYTQSDFAGTSSCSSGSLDQKWCPTGRQDQQVLGTDYVGIYIKAKHPMLTRFFGSSLNLTGNSVMRIEPKGG